jgi:hypothetical protein
LIEEVHVSETSERKQKLYGGIPAWAWLSGLCLGVVIGTMMFDNWIVGVVFGFSIGTAFAIAFHQSER